MFRKEDIDQIEQRGSSVNVVEGQVERFRKGFPWLKIVAPATPERGIQVLDEEAVAAAVKYYETAKVNGKCKFVPASGAASRMFKDLFSGLDALKAGKELADDAPAAKFVDSIQGFAFYTPELFGDKVCACPEYRKDVLSKTPLQMKDLDMVPSLRVFLNSISMLTVRSVLPLQSIWWKLRII